MDYIINFNNKSIVPIYIKDNKKLKETLYKLLYYIIPICSGTIITYFSKMILKN